jgi:hypothetical protein
MKRRKAMKLVTKIVAVLLMVGFFSGLAYAQAGTAEIKVNVPFQFVIGRTTYFAGQYSILSTHEKIWVQDANGRNVTALFASALDGKVPDHDGRVVFDCYYGECFLSQVWIAGQQTGQTLPKSKRALELAKMSPVQKYDLAGISVGR